MYECRDCFETSCFTELSTLEHERAIKSLADQLHHGWWELEVISHKMQILLGHAVFLTGKLNQHAQQQVIIFSGFCIHR